MDFSSSTITETDTETELVGGPATQIDFRDLGQNCSTLSGYYYLAGNPSLLGEVSKCYLFVPRFGTILMSF